MTKIKRFAQSVDEDTAVLEVVDGKIVALKDCTLSIISNKSGTKIVGLKEKESHEI